MKVIYKDESTEIYIGEGRIKINYKDVRTGEAMAFIGSITTLANGLVKLLNQEMDEQIRNNSGN